MEGMISMELSSDDAQRLNAAMGPTEQKGPKYPYGLRISLDDATLEKLGIKDLPAVDSEMKLMAVVEVASAGVHEDQGGKRRHLDLQITDLKLAPSKSEKSDAEKIYDKDGNKGTTKDKPGTVYMEDN